MFSSDRKQSPALQQPVGFIINSLVAACADALLICACWLVLKQGSDRCTAQPSSRCCMLLEERHVSSEVGWLGQLSMIGMHTTREHPLSVLASLAVGAFR